MLDANLELAPLARTRSTALGSAKVEPGHYLLLTLHREANVRPDSLARIAQAMNDIDEPIVFPGHPRTRARGQQNRARSRNPSAPAPPATSTSRRLPRRRGSSSRTPAVCRRRPTGTGLPCITLRPTSEWVETIETGWNRLVGDDPELILAAVADATAPADHPPLYGDGNASTDVADLLWMGAQLRETSPSSVPATSDSPSLRCSRRRVVRPRRHHERVINAINRGESHIEDVPSESLAPLVEAAHSGRRPTTTPSGETRRDPDRAPDAAHAPARARSLDRQLGARASRSAAQARPARRARIDDLPRNDARGAPADPRDERPEGGRGLPPRLLPRARRPGPDRLDDEEHAQGRGRRDARLRRARRRRSTAARSTPSCRVSTPDAAELAKLLENTFRVVNIALVNELAVLCDRMGVDVWEVVDAAATKPFGFMSFSPGPRPRRPLHPGRSVLPHVEGARVRLPHGVHRARRQGQRGDAVLLPPEVSQALNHERAAGAEGLAASSCSASPTRRTSATCANRRRSR